MTEPRETREGEAHTDHAAGGVCPRCDTARENEKYSRESAMLFERKAAVAERYGWKNAAAAHLEHRAAGLEQAEYWRRVWAPYKASDLVRCDCGESLDDCRCEDASGWPEGWQPGEDGPERTDAYRQAEHGEEHHDGQPWPMCPTCGGCRSCRAFGIKRRASCISDPTCRDPEEADDFSEIKTYTLEGVAGRAIERLLEVFTYDHEDKVLHAALSDRFEELREDSSAAPEPSSYSEPLATAEAATLMAQRASGEAYARIQAIEGGELYEPASVLLTQDEKGMPGCEGSGTWALTDVNGNDWYGRYYRRAGDYFVYCDPHGGLFQRIPSEVVNQRGGDDLGQWPAIARVIARRAERNLAGELTTSS